MTIIIVIKAIIWILFIIGLVVFIHELGHFMSAKLLGIKVQEFAFGFGKKIIGKKFMGTLYRINYIPLGGYVRILGQEEESDKPQSFSTKSLSTKLTILLAGVFMNFLLAVVTFYIVLGFRDFSIHLPVLTDYEFMGTNEEVQYKPFVRKVFDDTPASDVDFPKDVIIWSVDEVEVKTVEDFINYLQEHEGEEITIKVLTLEGKYVEKNVVPKKTGREGVLLGIEFYESVAAFYKLDYSKNKALSGVLHSINFTGYSLDVFGDLIEISYREKSVKPVSEGVSGLIGVASTVFDLVRVGDVLELLNLLAGINLSLAVINLLPIPGLDGGYVLFFIIEKIRGRKLSEKYMEWAVRFGFAFMILLLILISIKDIIQFNVLSRLLNVLKNII